MLQTIIEYHKNEWINSDECTIKPIISYIRNKEQLRDAQINALETYLFLKIKGQNKPLWQLFSEGFFSTNEDLSKLNINQISRKILEENIAARSLFEFSRFKLKNSNYNKDHIEINKKLIISSALIILDNIKNQKPFKTKRKKSY